MPEIAKISRIFPDDREIRCGEQLAADCVIRQRAGAWWTSASRWKDDEGGLNPKDATNERDRIDPLRKTRRR